MARPSSPAKRRPPRSKAAAPFDGDESKLVVMGRVSAPFGIQGWVKLKSFTDSPDGLAGFPRWLLKRPEGWREVEVEDFAVHSAATVVKLEGIDDRDAAETLRGFEVAVLRTELGEADKGSIYWVDLVGLEVVSLKGEKLGQVETLFQTGETSVLVVRGSSGRGEDSMDERERMIPFVDVYVKSVDRDARRITVDWEADYDI